MKHCLSEWNRKQSMQMMEISVVRNLGHCASFWNALLWFVGYFWYDWNMRLKPKLLNAVVPGLVQYGSHGGVSAVCHHPPGGLVSRYEPWVSNLWEREVVCGGGGGGVAHCGQPGWRAGDRGVVGTSLGRYGPYTTGGYLDFHVPQGRHRSGHIPSGTNRKAIPQHIVRLRWLMYSHGGC